MNNWTKISEILTDCLEIRTSERRKYLIELDIESEIRVEVESFLEFETDTQTFMTLSAADVSKDFIPASLNGDNSHIAQQIGIYKVIKELGIGGMGAVYLAERTDGKFEQKVALKLLKREFNIEKIRRIFKREKEILATLSHPNIARLPDAGKTDDGIPYLVMEYVEGVPVDKFCLKNSLELNERLKGFTMLPNDPNFKENYETNHKFYLQAAIPKTDKNKYELAETYLREALPTFRRYYKEDNPATAQNECMLTYSLLMQNKMTDFERQFKTCKELEKKLHIDSKEIIKMIENASAKKNKHI